MTVIRVGPKESNPTHDLALTDLSQRWGLRLDGGIRSIQEIANTPSSIFATGGGRKYGSGDPLYSHIQQDSWISGRGQEDFSDDDSRYYSGSFINTMVPGRLIPAWLWKWADTDARDYNMHQPGSVSWQQLRASQRYYASKFTIAAQDTTNYAADKAYILMRRRGNPGTLTVELWTDSAGSPNAIIGSITATTTISTITDVVSLWKVFDWTGTTTLTHGTDYWIVVYGASTDNATNHWEVGVDTSGSASKISSAGSSWSDASSTMYHRVVDVDAPMKAHGFFLNSTEMYYVTEKDSGASTIFTWDESNDEWDGVGALTGDAISNTVSSVAVSNDIAHMARSSTEVIFTFDNGSGFRGQDDATAGNNADVLLATFKEIDGPQIWRAENGTSFFISRSDVKAFNTDLVFSTDVQMPKGYDVLNMAEYNNQPWIRTTDALWNVVNDRPRRLNVGLDGVVELDTYDAPIMPKDVFLFFGWWASVERYYGGTLDDVGPWQDAGLPDGFQGSVSALAAGVGMDFVGVDGGTSNTSSVYAVTGNGELYHPIWQAWEAGQRVRNIWLQSQTSSNNMRLWISVGTDTVFLDLPDNSLNPLRDSTQAYCWEGVIELSAIDMGAASLPKLFKELSVIAKNLGSTASISVDYQIDENVGSTTDSDWIHVTDLYRSPRDIAELNLGNRERIRIRLRMNTSTSTTPVEVIATVLKGLARTPVKRQWNMRVKISDLQRTKRGAQDHDPRDFYSWIRESAGSAEALLMEANDPLMHNIYVFLEPPSLFRKFLNTIQGWLGGTVALTLREA